MTDLIAELERATEGSFALDCKIAAEVGSKRVPPRAYSVSLDAALTLVPEGLCWRYDSALGFAEIFDLTKSPIFVAGSSDDPCLGSKPPALALCIAALKARQTQEVERKLIDA